MSKHKQILVKRLFIILILGVLFGLNVSRADSGNPTVVIPGWFGEVAWSTKSKVWLLVSQGEIVKNKGHIFGRILDNNQKLKSGPIQISPDSEDGVYTPLVAYSPDIDKFLVMWFSFPNPNGPTGDYGAFVSTDGKVSNVFQVNTRSPILNSGIEKLSDLKYDAVNKKFVFVWGFGSAQIGTIDLNGKLKKITSIANITDINNAANDKPGYTKKVAVNEDSNEYCVIYDLRNSGRWGMAKIDASTLNLVKQAAINTFAWDTDIAYNSATKKYLAVYDSKERVSTGRILNSCDPNDTAGNDFIILRASSIPKVAANSTSDTFGVIGQNHEDPGSDWAVIDSDGNTVSQGTLLTDSRNGQFVPNIGANTSDGTYAIITDRDYEETVILTGVGTAVSLPENTQSPEPESSVAGQPFPSQPVSTPPTQGLPTDLGQLIQQIFAWSLDILGIAVFVMFFYSGFLWLTAAGNTSKISEARTHMTNAIFGAILLLSSYLILYTINPDFVKNTINLPGLDNKK